MAKNKNPMIPEVYEFMVKFAPDGTGRHVDLHHAIFSKGDVMGMPLESRRLIHNPLNLLWIPKEVHASHADVPSRAEAYKLLCGRWGCVAVDDYVTDMLSKFKVKPFTLESLQGE